MELRRFEQFIALAEEGSFTAAATRLYLAQSSLSESIAALERDLGVRLVVRTRGGIELTEAGRAFLGPARKTVREAAEAKLAAAGRATAAPPLRVANTFVSPGLEAEFAAAALQRLHPDLEIRFSHYGLRTVTSRVADGEVDVALTPVRHPLPDTLSHLPLPPIPLGVICAPGHRLAGAEAITIQDLIGETLILTTEESPIRDAIIDAYRAANADHGLHVAAEGWLNGVSLARRGLGVILGPLFASDYYPPDIAVARFAHPPIMESAIVTRSGREQHPVLAEYLDLYQAALKRPQ